MKLFKKINCKETEIATNISEYKFEPFERGIASTLGNSLRRTLISSLSSYAVIAIKVKNAKHEFSTLPEVVEDLPSIILNIKNIVFLVKNELFSNGEEQIKVSLLSKSGKVLAKIIECPTGVEIVNKDLQLATTTKDGALKIDFILEYNRGYESFALNNTKKIPLDFIGVDAIYSPVKNVSFNVEELNTHKNSIEEMLKIVIETDGSITPGEALDRSAAILISHFKVFLVESEDKNKDNEDIVAKTEEKQFNHYYNWPIEHLNLNIRTYNSLKRANVNTIKEILNKSRGDLNSMKNFGDKAFNDLINALKHKKIDVSKFL